MRKVLILFLLDISVSLVLMRMTLYMPMVTNPTEALDWLQESIDELKASSGDLAPYFYIFQALYNGETGSYRTIVAPFVIHRIGPKL